MPKFPFLEAESDEMLHLDLLRFFAAYGIVVLHLQVFLDLSPKVRDVFNHNHLARFVDLFFVISGFIISFVYAKRMRTWKEYGTFMRRRVARLLPLHWLTLAIFAALGAYIHQRGVQVNHGQLWDFSCLWSNAAFLNAVGTCSHPAFNSVSWSIGAEMFMYAGFPVFLFVSASAPKTVPFLIAGLLVTFAFASRAALPWYDWTFQAGALRALPSFLFGMMLFELRGRLRTLPFPRVLCWSLFATFLVGAIASWNGWILVGILYLVAITAVAADVQKKGGDVLRRIAPWGKLTYSIYMIHPLVMVVALNLLLDRMLRPHGAVRNILVISAAALVMPLALLSYEWFETPLRRYLSGGGRNRRRSSRDDLQVASPAAS
jgi:peptidoglycan/LPS O-acetylase OafA/YrhL